jgi:hypothetical protein
MRWLGRLTMTLAAMACAAGCSDGSAPAKPSGKGPRLPGVNLPPAPVGDLQPNGTSGSAPQTIDQGDFELVLATPDTVGTKGKGYGGDPISEPIRQRFRVEYDLQLMNIKYALKLYEASHGNAPASHEEFMQNIVNSPEYGVKLPELPTGQSYVFDPKSQQLYVRRPKAKPQG